MKTKIGKITKYENTKFGKSKFGQYNICLSFFMESSIDQVSAGEGGVQVLSIILETKFIFLIAIRLVRSSYISTKLFNPN